MRVDLVADVAQRRGRAARAPRRRSRATRNHTAVIGSPYRGIDRRTMASTSSNQPSRAEQQVEVEEVVGRERRADVGLGELGREAPDLHADSGGHEEVDDAPARVLGHGLRAGRALEAVRALLVVRAHTHREVVRLAAARPRSSGNLLGWWSLGRAPFSAQVPIHRQAPGGLETSMSGVRGTARVRATIPAVAVDHVRPPGGRADLPGEHAPGVPPRPGARGPRARDRRPALGRRRGRPGPRRAGPAGPPPAPGAGHAVPRTLAELDVPRLADLYDECGTDFELSVDVKQRERGPPADRGRACGRQRCARTAVALLRVAQAARRAARGGARREARLLPRSQPGRRRRRWSATRRISRRRASTASTCTTRSGRKGSSRCSTASGSQTFAWDTQETRYILAALRQGIDGIYCDRVDRMVATVGEWSDSDSDAG